MDEALLERLESSFEALKPHSELLIETFYTKLFNDHPEGLIVERDGVDVGVVTPQVIVNALATAGDAS